LNKDALEKTCKDERIIKAFMAADKDSKIPKPTRLSIYKRICRSAFNPRAQDNYRMYAEQHTSIFSRKSKHTAFRTELEERGRKTRLMESDALDAKRKKVK